MSDIVNRLRDKWALRDRAIWRAQHHEAADEIERLRRRVYALEQALKRLFGWREYDWPEGFCRRTAEELARHVKDGLP